MIADVRSIRWMKMLGAAGLIPFAALAFLAGRAEDGMLNTLALLQLGYAAIILSFFGGVHWIEGLRRNNLPQILLAMLPSIAGFGLMSYGLLNGPLYALGLFALAFIGVLGIDKAMLDPASLPQGYLRFRCVLTFCVCACLLATAASVFFARP